MNILDTASAYQPSTASAASSVGQVVALYARILRDFRSVIAAIGAEHIENRVNSLNHALTIIGELQGGWTSSAEVNRRGISTVFTRLPGRW